MYVLKDGNGVDLGHEPTYVSYLSEISISRPQVNRHHWDWLAPYNAKIKELIERNKRRNGPIFGLNEDLNYSNNCVKNQLQINHLRL